MGAWQLAQAQQICFDKYEAKSLICFTVPCDAEISMKNKYTVDKNDTVYTMYQVVIDSVLYDSLYLTEKSTNQSGRVRWRDLQLIHMNEASKGNGWSLPAAVASTTLGVIALAGTFASYREGPLNRGLLLLGVVSLAGAIPMYKKSNLTFTPVRYGLSR